MFHLSGACVCPNCAIYLVFVSNAVNLTFGNGAQNVQIVRVKGKKFAVAIMMHCGEGTL